MTDFAVENMVTVKILGENYPIAASNDVAYISKVADYVDSRMRDVATRSRFQARDKVAILAAMSIASELLEKSEDVSQFEEQQSVGLDRLLARLDGAIDGDPSNAD